jgi:hypothetical protein
VRGFLGACFLRAARLTFLRSSLLSALVFAIRFLILELFLVYACSN